MRPMRKSDHSQRWWWAGVLVATAVLLLLPQVVGLFSLLQISVICILAMLGLSQGFMWGFIGILSFGQTAFFGLGGYTYAVTALNTHATGSALIAAILLPALFAALVGYFMIYGRISDVYLGVITLVVTLILEKVVRATSGSQYVIGSVRIGGQNGIPTVPPLAAPWDASITLGLPGVFYLSVICLVVVYVGLKLLLGSKFGRIMVGIRENERSEERRVG